MLADGKIITARLKGKFKLQELDTTNPIAVGDFVTLETTDGGEYIINEIHPRHNYIIRQSPRNKHQRHIIGLDSPSFRLTAHQRNFIWIQFRAHHPRADGWIRLHDHSSC